MREFLSNLLFGGSCFLRRGAARVVNWAVARTFPPNA